MRATRSINDVCIALSSAVCIVDLSLYHQAFFRHLLGDALGSSEKPR